MHLLGSYSGSHNISMNVCGFHLNGFWRQCFQTYYIFSVNEKICPFIIFHIFSSQCNEKFMFSCIGFSMNVIFHIASKTETDLICQRRQLFS